VNVDRARTALIQDLQNDVISEGGAFADSGAPPACRSSTSTTSVEKMRMNGFFDTRLDTLLRGLGVETILITGAWTNMSIEHTARHGADAGYEVVVVSDGTSTVSDEWQDAGLSYALTNVGRTATAAELTEALRG
jgi:nicotinamidase-related amidase